MAKRQSKQPPKKELVELICAAPTVLYDGFTTGHDNIVPRGEHVEVDPLLAQRLLAPMRPRFYKPGDAEPEWVHSQPGLIPEEAAE